MSIAPAWPQCLAFFDTPLVIEPSAAATAVQAANFRTLTVAVVRQDDLHAEERFLNAMIVARS